MKFNIHNGEGVISIGTSDIGAYFSYKRPLSVVWDDNQGSFGKYFCLLPYSEEYRKDLNEKISSNLNEDFTGKEEELRNLLQPILSLFKNGEYGLNFYLDSKEQYFAYSTGDDNKSYATFEVHYSEPVEIKRSQEILQEVNMRHKNDGFYISDYEMLLYSTSHIYEDNAFIATQPENKLNEQRVEHFEEQIKKGERPFAIIVKADDSSHFILDGHHKLKAYENLGMYPALTIITYYPGKNAEFDLNLLAEFLYPWQVRHMLGNWHNKGPYILQKLKDDPSCKLSELIKNGLIKEYYSNGELRHEAFYVNDEIEGVSKYWYNTGQLMRIEHYSKGKRIGRSEYYSPSGKITRIQNFNEDGEIDGEDITYFENGKISQQIYYTNGRYADGISFRTWNIDGRKVYEGIYKDGKFISGKNGRNKELSHKSGKLSDKFYWQQFRYYVGMTIVIILILGKLIQSCN